MPLVLIAEDDLAVQQSLQTALELEGFTVVVASDGEAALEAISERSPDLLLLDVQMPRKDGIEVCRELRAGGNDIPILIITAKESVADRVQGLEAGADDYLAKPYALEELLARINALMRRTSIADAGTISYAGVRMDLGAHRAWIGERELHLSKTEFALLELLIRGGGKVIEKEVIYDQIWGYDFGPNSKNLAVYIGYLRNKLELEGEDRVLHTSHGLGYMLK